MRINLFNVVVILILIFFFSSGYAERLDLSKIPDSVPGDSFANKDKNIMIQLYGRALIISESDYKCAEPKVMLTKVTNDSPIDSANKIREIREQWDVDACGKHVGLFFGIAISDELPNGMIIETAHGVKENSDFLTNNGNSQNKLSELIVGKWGNSFDGGKTFWAYDEYTSDGEIISYGEPPESGIKFNILSDYKINGSTSCAIVKKTSHPDIMSIGHKTCSEIRDINEKNIIFKSEDGKITVLYRVVE